MYDLDAGLQGFNLFIYCGNDPVNRIDSSGADSEKNDDLDLDDDEVTEKGGSGSGYFLPSNPVNSGNNSNQSSRAPGGKISQNSVAMSTDDALDTAIDFLGPGYTEASPAGYGRYVSADGLRQVRIGYNDITGAHAGAPHINIEHIGKSGYASFHIYLLD